MPRANWKRLPDDPEKQPAYIDKILGYSKNEKVLSVLNGYPSLRGLHFRPTNFRDDIDLRSIVFAVAVAIQLRGVVAEAPCDCCKSDERVPFSECIRIPSAQLGRCANCIYLRAFCSHGDHGKL
jgi:hypothetical protein